MSTYKKKDILKIMESLEKVNNTIVNNDSTKVFLLDALAECQSAALEVGNALESYGDVYKNIVQVLEEYCENVYQLYIHLDDMHRCKKIGKKIRKQLIQIINDINKELPNDKIEIVFLPYKASMWDSLESIWRAASLDARCETYVVPIPYYDKKPDNTFGELHYEGLQYPSYVPIKSWEEYDISERKPDIIFIHNPYDSYNIVTSVPLQFYASELQKHTEMLVYVPYFVAIEENVGKHFCTVPGVLYSHKVIVQSEKVRQTYIEELFKYEQKYNCKGNYGKVEEKILALGSPKYDKVSSTQVEEIEVTKDWEQMIIKPDGSKKKVVFYNTTIDAILNQPNMLHIIEQVISMFEGNNDILMLWRPHPLLKSTLEVMRKDLLLRYTEIEERYKSERIGIFDDSADLYRAITLSDVYYGDWSSVTELYTKTNKPVVLQTAGYNGTYANIRTFFLSGMTYYKGSLYGLSFDKNIILKANKNEGTFTYNGLIPKTTNCLSEYCVIAAVNNKLFFVPFMQDTLLIYDLETENCEEICLCLREELKIQNVGHFSNYCIYHDQLFLIPFGYRAIVSYNLITNEVKHVAFLDHDFPTNSEKQLFTDYEYLDESHLILPTFNTNRIMIFSMFDASFSVIELGDKDYKYCGIKKYNDDFFIVLKNKLMILKCNSKFGIIDKLNNFPLNCKESTAQCFEYKAMCRYQNYLFCFPMMCNMAIKVNLDTGNIEQIEAFNKYCNAKEINTNLCIFDGAFVEGENIYLQYQNNLILHYNIKTDKVIEIRREIYIEDEVYKEIFGKFIIGLPSEVSNRLIESVKDTAGEKILNEIMSYQKS